MKVTTDIEQVFEPLLRQFCKATIPINIDEDFSSVFIPHVMTGYFQADRKIFYFGRDTYGWKPTRQLMQAYSENNLLNYIEESSKWANDFGFLEYNKNKSSGFWTLALRLHLRLKGFTENLSISSKLPEQYYNHINDFGWGNTNAIEVPKSLENRRIWETLDKDKYCAVKGHSKTFDKLIHTIIAYKPDIVFIFNWNWDCDRNLFLKGLKYHEQKFNLIGNHFTSYYLPDTNTKIYWTIHPNAARWLGYGTNRIIDEIMEYLKTETESKEIIPNY